MNVIGLSFDFHDSSAALIVDGEVVAAAHEERFTRIKHDAALPINAINFCLSSASLTINDIDQVVYYEQPLKKFDRILSGADTAGSDSEKYIDETLYSWFKVGKFDVKKRISDAIGVDFGKITLIDHHDAHMAAAYYCSGFSEATIVTIDGVGEYDTAVLGVGRGNRLERRAVVQMPHSLGLFYSAFTAFLGFEINEGEYKVMGMAGFGQPTHFEKMMSFFDLKDDGTFLLSQDCFNFLTPEDLPYRPALIERFGPARKAESPFATRIEDLPGGLEQSKASAIVAESLHYADIAASVQKCAEEVILHIVDRAVKATGITNVCLAGGVALNSLANGRLQRDYPYHLYIQPASGDGGSALGAAAYYTHAIRDLPRRAALANAYLGRAFDRDAILAAVKTSGYSDVEIMSGDDELAARVAGLLAEGCVIGWFQGRAEWGPRALGHRSILADPTNAAMKAVVNEQIKFRELFRPFAPAIPVENLHQYFECNPIRTQVDPEFFMLAVHPVRPEMRTKIPAVTHVDGTARVQAVSAQSDPLFYKLLKNFGAIKGVPILLNTSFNLRGEPIVDAPADALRTFSYSNLDYLVLNDVIIKKGVAL